MSTSPIQIFTGSSTFASDFQSVITRAVAIASLPLNQYQSQKTDMTAQSNVLSGLDTTFTALQTAISNLDTATGPASYSSASSDPTSVGATIGAGALAGTYTVDVVSLGSATSTLSGATLPAVSDPYSTSISTSTSFNLTVNGTSFSIQPTDGSLIGLAQAINNSAANVQASLVNVGSSGSPSYRLAIRSTKLGTDTIQLNDGKTDLLDTLSTGAQATYHVNGLSTLIESDSRTITLAPGVSANLLQTTGATPATITVDRNTSSVESGLTAFVTAYNAAVDAIDAQHGTAGGALSGQSVLGSLTDILRQVTQYNAGSGSGIQSLYSMGISMDDQGKLSLDSSQFESSDPSAVMDFLGSASSSGFLKTASDAMNLAEDSTTGVVKEAISSLNTEMTHQDDLIATTQSYIDDLQSNLQQQMAAADAAIASMQQQVSFMTQLFQSMNSINNNNNGSSNG
jgi:flagellar hook-associated protein 2